MLQCVLWQSVYYLGYLSIASDLQAAWIRNIPFLNTDV